LNAAPPAKANTWWFTGLPAAGKTTLAQALAGHLRALGQAACVLDGDRIRQGLNKNLGFSTLDREENMRRVAEIAKLLNESGIHALVALVSPTLAGRTNARRIVGENFIEVHVATPLPVCQQRDPKGLYARALAHPGSGLTGVDAPFEIPETPEIIIDTSIMRTEEAVFRLLDLAGA
jgi:adenylylsulfate kinase